MNTLLIFVRHGETEINKDKKLHKDKDPIELNEAGKEQVRKTARKVKTYNPDVIYSSKERRAIQSAERGDFSGKTWPEIQNVLDKMTLEERFNYIPPNGESWKEFDARLKSRLDEFVNKHKGETVVIVTHGGVIRALVPHLLGVPKEESFKYDPDNASLTIFKHDGKKFVKQTVNETSHLKS